MASYEDSERAVAEAERLIAADEYSRALDQVEVAAEALPRNAEDAAPLIAEIGELLNAVMAHDPKTHEPQIRAIRGLLPRQAADKPEVESGEPGIYALSEVIASLATVIAVLSVIAGLVLGVAASKYTDGSGTHHHGSVIFAGIASGLTAAVLWLAVASGLRVVVANGRMLRELTGRGVEPAEDA